MSSIKVLPSDCNNDEQLKWQWHSKRLYCHFWLSVVAAIARGQFLRARRGRKVQICRWNFDDFCDTFGLGGYIAISDGPPMPNLFVDTFFEFAVVISFAFAARITIVVLLRTHSAVRVCMSIKFRQFLNNSCVSDIMRNNFRCTN